MTMYLHEEEHLRWNASGQQQQNELLVEEAGDAVRPTDNLQRLVAGLELDHAGPQLHLALAAHPRLLPRK